jgi:hypothetical protein
MLAGFAAAPPSLPLLMEKGEPPRPRHADGALVFYALLLNVEKGDRLAISVDGPGGFLAQGQSPAMNRHKAQYLGFAGRRLRSRRWPAGKYVARIRLTNGGRLIWSKRLEMTMPK